MPWKCPEEPWGLSGPCDSTGATCARAACPSLEGPIEGLLGVESRSARQTRGIAPYPADSAVDQLHAAAGGIEPRTEVDPLAAGEVDGFADVESRGETGVIRAREGHDELAWLL